MKAAQPNAQSQRGRGKGREGGGEGVEGAARLSHSSRLSVEKGLHSEI